MFVDVAMHNLFSYKYIGKWPQEILDISYSKFVPHKDHTYFAICGPQQQKELELLEKDPRFKILYKAPKAVNKNYLSDGARNTLFILEKSDDPLQTVPAV